MIFLIFTTLIGLSLLYLIYYECLKPYGSIRKTLVRPLLSLLLTSKLSLISSRLYYLLRRRVKNRIHLHAFISIDDSQSFVLLQCLSRLVKIYQSLRLEFVVEVRVLPRGKTAWSSSFDDARKWTLQNSQQFARIHDMMPPEESSQDTILLTNKLSSALLRTEHLADPLSAALAIFTQYWTNKVSPIDYPPFDEKDQVIMQLNWRLMEKLGYYGPGVVYTQGEWFPPDRLHHLERLLLKTSKILSDRYAKYPFAFFFTAAWYHFYEEETERAVNDTLLFNQHLDHLDHPSRLPGASPAADELSVEFFYSFRSPYSQILVPRLRSLCDKYGVPLRVRVMMPMVMRGLSVPYAKKKYIATDCAREARLWNIPFGPCCDPIEPEGRPVQRALDAFLVAASQGKDLDFISSFAELVWGRGVDAGTDRGLRLIVERAGLAWSHVRSVLGTRASQESWTTITDNNRDYLRSRGLWGVPCVECGAVLVWGQDSLYLIEQVLRERNKND